MRTFIIYFFLLCSLSAFAQPTLQDTTRLIVFDPAKQWVTTGADLKTFIGAGSGDITNGGNTTGAAVVIGTNDANALNLETNNVARVAITGGASTGGAMTLTDVTANTSTVEDAVTIQTNSSGTAAAGFGGAIKFQGESSTTDNQDMGRISSIWTTATHASRASALTFSTLTAAGSLTERMRILGNGNVGIGTSSPFFDLDVKGDLAWPATAINCVNQYNHADSSLTRGILSSEYSTTYHGAHITTRKARGTYSSPVAIQSGDYLAAFLAEAYDGTTFDPVGNIVFVSTGISGGNISTKLEFTTANAGVQLPKMTILADGKIGIGTISPTAKVHIAAGAAAANGAPLKLTSGTNLTTPENGAVEYDGTDYYVTSGGTRYTLAKVLKGSATLDFVATAPGPASELTISVTGAAVGDVVSLGVDGTTVAVANGSFTAFVSSTNTVTVRYTNNDLVSSYNPGSATFKVTVTK